MTLHESVAAGDVAGVRRLAESGAKLDRCYPESDECVLATAAAQGDLAMVQELLRLGAKVNNKKSVVQPLEVAVGQGHLEVARLLLSNGADPNAKDEDGTTPLMTAAFTGNEALVRLLVEHRADVRANDFRGTTALQSATAQEHDAVCEFLSPLATPKDREKCRILREIRMQGGTDERVAAMIMAAGRGDFSSVRSFVADGVPFDAINEEGVSALMRAANKNQMMIVQWLLDRGANVNRTDVYGESPVTCAAMGCHPEMVEFLSPMSDKKLAKRALKIKDNQIAVGNWPSK
jgi:hypothetical protein